jgi:hypothetical protein
MLRAATRGAPLLSKRYDNSKTREGVSGLAGNINRLKCFGAFYPARSMRIT